MQKEADERIKSKMKLLDGHGEMADERRLPNDGRNRSISQEGPDVDGEGSSDSRSALTSTNSSEDAVARVAVSDLNGPRSAPIKEEDESLTEASNSEKKRPLQSLSESGDGDSGAETMEDDDNEESAENKLKMGLVEGNQAKWDEIFGRLLRYKEDHGDCLVPNRYEPDPSLGAWVSTQRR